MVCLRFFYIFVLLVLIVCLKMMSTVAQDLESDNIAPSPAMATGDGFAPATSVGLLFTFYVINLLINMH